MANDKLNSILQKILDGSKAGKIDWEKNSRSDEAFYYHAKDSIINVMKISTEYLFLVSNSQGVEIGRLSSKYPAYQIPITDLYKLARRKVLKIDETLDSLDNFLNDLLK